MRPTMRTVDAIAADEGRGRLVIWTGETWEWDGERLAKARVASQPRGLGVAMAYDWARREVVMFGGAAGPVLDETWTYDGTSWTLRQPATKPPARLFGSMAYDVVRQRVVLFGGRDGSNLLNDTWEWDGRNWTRRTTAIAPPARFAHQMAYDLVRRRVVLHGGGGTGTTPLPQTWEWDGTNWSVAAVLGTPGAVIGASMAFDRATGEILLYGGRDRTGLSTTLWAYKGGVWSTKTPTQIPRSSYGRFAFHAASRRSVLFGFDTNSGAFDGVWEWASNNWRSRVLADDEPQRVDPALAFDSKRGQTLFFGGSDLSSGAFGDATWEFRADAWMRRKVAQRPSPRAGACMAYDQARDRMLLFGGRDDPFRIPPSDTWEWDGNQWSDRTGVMRPAGRAYGGLVYDSSRRRSVLFGGVAGQSSFFDDTWEWNGMAWARVATASRPSARSHFAMAYDPVRRRVVVFGGRQGRGAFGDTWEYDGANWLQRTSMNTPPARSEAAMCFDPVRRRILLHGGRSGLTTILTDTWEYDGANWRMLSPSTTEAGIGKMVYDTVAACPILIDTSSRVSRFAIPARVLTRGQACAGAVPAPRLLANMPRLGAQRHSYDLQTAVSSTPCIFGFSTVPQNLALGGGCSLYLGAPLSTFGAVSNALGFASFDWSVPFDPALRGLILHAQGFVLDARSPVLGLAFSSALDARIGH